MTGMYWQDCIVTANLQDFPASVLNGFGLEAIDPGTFIINQWGLDPVSAIAAFKLCHFTKVGANEALRSRAVEQKTLGFADLGFRFAGRSSGCCGWRDGEKSKFSIKIMLKLH